MRFVSTLRSCNKQRLLPSASFTSWFFYWKHTVFSVRYGLIVIRRFRNFAKSDC